MKNLLNLFGSLATRVRPRNDDGWAVFVAIAVMTIMLAVGLAIMSVADNQIRTSRTDRIRESSFNLAEGALTAQQYRLPFNWPGTVGTAYPTQCPDPLDANNPRCPVSSVLLGTGGLFNSDTNGGAEFESNNPAWRTRVRDNNIAYPGSGWNDYTSATDSNVTWDQNGDSRMWVRSDGWTGRCPSPPVANTSCKRRAVVGLLGLEKFQESIPKNVLTTGGFAITPNSTQHSYVCVYGQDAQGNCVTSSSSGSQVLVRCTPVPGLDGTPSGPCEGYNTNQIVPNIVTSGGSTYPPTMNSGTLERFINSAMTAGTYCRIGVPGSLPGFCSGSGGACPDLDLAPTGAIVVIDPTLSTQMCSYLNNGIHHLGMLIMTDGFLEIGGSRQIYGVVYHTHGCSPTFNPPNDVTGCPASLVPGTAGTPQVSIQGTAKIFGGLAVDGLGFTVLGSNSDGALSFDPNAFVGLATVGSAGLVQSTWRELPANQP